MKRLGPFGPGTSTHARGAAGEEAAEHYLSEQGYRIVARNVRTHLGELDIVALDGETLCFVEIKTRSSGDYGPAIAAVGPAKQRRLAGAASLFLAKNRSRRACRFDVLGIDRDSGGAWRFTLIRDAFRLG